MGGACDKVEGMLQKVATTTGNRQISPSYLILQYSVKKFASLYEVDSCISGSLNLHTCWVVALRVPLRVKLLGNDGTFCLFKIC